MLLVVKKKCEGLEYNIDFGGRGWEYAGGGGLGIDMSTMQKEAFFEVSQHFYPLLL